VAALTLAQMLDEVQKALWDATPETFADAYVQRAVSAALQEINRYWPRLTNDANIKATAGEREYSIATLGALAVVGVWFPYVDNDYPPHKVGYQMLDDVTLFLDVDDDPKTDEVIRIFYLAGHTISGLDSASASTLSKILEELVIEGAVAHSCAYKAADVIGEISTSDLTPQQWRELADQKLSKWYQRLWRLRRDPNDARAGAWPVDKWDTQS
jgi:hypothetical protein